MTELRSSLSTPPRTGVTARRRNSIASVADAVRYALLLGRNTACASIPQMAREYGSASLSGKSGQSCPSPAPSAARYPAPCGCLFRRVRSIRVFQLGIPMIYGHRTMHQRFVVHHIHRTPFWIIQIRHPTRHTRAKVGTDLTKDHSHTAGHVFTPVASHSPRSQPVRQSCAQQTVHPHDPPQTDSRRSHRTEPCCR